MRFASSISTLNVPENATEELLRDVAEKIPPHETDLVLFFTTAHFEEEIPDVVARLSAAFPKAKILGCTAEGTIGVDREIEGRPSMSILAGSLPEVEIRPFYVRQELLEKADTVDAWERICGVSAESKPVFIAFADPFRLDVHALLDRLNEFFPGAPLAGGIASSGHAPYENRLILQNETIREGAVAIALTGAVQVQSVVSQGCRPIAKPFVITKGERNIVRELGGRPALEQLQSILITLSEKEEQLARQSLFLGRVVDEYKAHFTRGDFLIQNIIGADRKSGAIGIAGHARVGATVQFHVRDAATADEDLHTLLLPHANTGVRAALLFGCNGRGTRMWSKPNHDVSVVREVLGNIPTAGLFCGGEFGPIGKKNFIHGYTASVALFRDPQSA